jgi:hypothetical protein
MAQRLSSRLSVRDNENMQSWPDRRLLDLLTLKIPIIQVPMAGADSIAFARSVSATALTALICRSSLAKDEKRLAKDEKSGAGDYVGVLLSSHISLRCGAPVSVMKIRPVAAVLR